MASRLSRQLVWYIALRVVVIITVMASYWLFGLTREDLTQQFLRFAVLPAFAATLAYIAFLRVLRHRPEVQAYIQFFGDLWLITGLIYWQGGIPNPLSVLYLVVITVASTLLRRRAGVHVAGVAFVLYGLLGLRPEVLHFLFFAKLPVPLPADEVSLKSGLLVHGIGFVAMALLTSYLARKATRAERELEEKSEHLADLQIIHRDIVESITSGLLTTDLDGLITSANQAGLEILRRPESELVGRRIQSSGLFSDEHWGELTAASDQRGKLRSEVELVRDNETAHIGFSVAHLTDSFGHHRGYIVIFQDLTRWRRMQEELRIKDRMVAVGELAAGLAHEIGNPLAAISGSVQLLSGMAQAQGDAQQQKLIDILLKESHRLDRTIKGFLRFARPREHSSIHFDIARLLSENFELLKNSEEVSAHHRLEIGLDPPMARLFADPDQISQIFWNLARNALRAMPEGGTLRVEGSLEDDFYRLRVIDTGHGMSEEQRANLFHPFQSFFDGGTGIGMAIVYRIVQEHGGKLRVESRPGAGTVIAVELPTASASVTLVSAEVGA